VHSPTHTHERAPARSHLALRKTRADKWRCSFILRSPLPPTSCLVPVDVTGVPCLYVFVDIQMDVDHLVDTVRLNFPKGARQRGCLVTPARVTPLALAWGRVGCFGGYEWCTNAEEPGVPRNSGRVQGFASVLRREACRWPNVWLGGAFGRWLAPQSPVARPHVRACDPVANPTLRPPSRVRAGARLLLAGTIQFSSAVQVAKARLAADYPGMEVPKCKPLSPGEVRPSFPTPPLLPLGVHPPPPGHHRS
jgi:hypothetical protein